jgi:ribosomal protein L12E/L44/L45/RPP1/RPP2
LRRKESTYNQQDPSKFAATASPVAQGSSAAAPEAAKEEEKVQRKEESDDDMGFGLFD